MKISIVSTAYPLRGGIAQYTGILHDKFVAAGHEVQVVTFKRQYPAFLFPGKTQMETGKEESVVIPSEPIIDSIGPLSWFKAASRIREFEPDLLLFKFWMPFFAPCFGTIARRVKRARKTKVCFLCDNVIPHERRPGDIAMTKYALKAADFFIVQSKVVEKQLLGLLQSPTYKLIPHPVYDIFGEVLEKTQTKKNLGISEEKVILFFGYVRAYKGLDIVIKAMPEILKKINVRLLIVGEFYDDEGKYQRLLDELNLRENASVYADFIPNEEVNQYFCSADVVVLPYKSATQSGIVQLANHFNKPCIITDVGGLAEVVLHEKTGFVVEPEKPQAIADAVVKYYAEEREKDFSKNVEKEKVKYSWDNMINGILGMVG